MRTFWRVSGIYTEKKKVYFDAPRDVKAGYYAKSRIRSIFLLQIQSGVVSQIQVFPGFHKVAHLSDMVGEMFYHM